MQDRWTYLETFYGDDVLSARLLQIELFWRRNIEGKI
jgi:hypothetical protein